MDWYVYGGKHHGERHYLPNHRAMRLPILEPVDFLPALASGDMIAPVITTASYHLAVFIRRDNEHWHIWVPDDVESGGELEHILRLALKKPERAREVVPPPSAELVVAAALDALERNDEPEAIAILRHAMKHRTDARNHDEVPKAVRGAAED